MRLVPIIATHARPAVTFARSAFGAAAK